MIWFQVSTEVGFPESASWKYILEKAQGGTTSMSVGCLFGPSPWWTCTHRHKPRAEANGLPAILWAPNCQIEHCTISDTWVAESKVTCKMTESPCMMQYHFSAHVSMDLTIKILHIGHMAVRSEWVWPDFPIQCGTQTQDFKVSSVLFRIEIEFIKPISILRHGRSSLLCSWKPST